MLRRLGTNKKSLVIVPVALALALTWLFLPVKEVSVEPYGTLSLESRVVVSVGYEAAYANPDTERQSPDALIVQTNLTGAVSDIQDDPDSPDANWLTYIDSKTDTVCRVSFPTPTGNPTVGADLQEFKIWVRQQPSPPTFQTRYPLTIATDNTEVPWDAENWVTPDEAKTNNTVYANITAKTFDNLDYSYQLKATNFGFTIPTGATINGVVVQWEGHADVVSVFHDLCQLIKGGTRQGDDKGTLQALPTSDAIETFGTSTDLWNVPGGLSPADINAATFGVTHAVGTTANNSEAYTDFLSITVYYTAPDPTVRIELYENGGSLATILADTAVSSITGALYSGTWNANLLGTADGSLVECYIYGTAVETTVEVGAVEWNVDYTPVPDISNLPTSKAFGNVSESTDYWSNGSAPTFPLDDLECFFAVTNNSSQAVNIAIRSLNFSGGTPGWTLAGTPAADTVTLKAGKSGDTVEGDMVTLTTVDQPFITGLNQATSLRWELKMETPTSFSNTDEKTATITLTATF